MIYTLRQRRSQAPTVHTRMSMEANGALLGCRGVANGLCAPRPIIHGSEHAVARLMVEP